jgi:transposase-like protein
MSDKQVRAQYTREFKLEAVRQVRAGQAIAVVAKVLGIPKASLGNWVRLSSKGELDDEHPLRTNGRRHDVPGKLLSLINQLLKTPAANDIKW